MPYSFLTFSAAVSQLAARLEDSGLVYWNQTNELLNCLIESVRFFQALTGSYKQRVVFDTAQNVCYYDLTNPSTVSSTPVAYTATDVEVANNVLAALLEPTLTYPTWTGTGQFSLAQLQSSIQNRLNRFLGETGCAVSQTTIADAVPTEVVSLPDGTSDMRRAAWITSAGPPAIEYPLGRLDEWAEQAYAPGAIQNPTNPPSNYSLYALQPQQIRMVPPPSVAGSVDILYVASGPALNLNPSSPVVLGIPDDLSPAIKWGVLSDLLSGDGQARDPARAAYCEQRYQEFVQIATLFPSVLTASIGNVTCGLGSVFDLDAYQPDWQQTTGAPGFVGMCGRNLACVGQTPDNTGPVSGNYEIELWMSVNIPVPGTPSTTYLQVSRGQIDPVLDYAQHVASFKMGGAEFQDTVKMYQNMVSCAMTQNERLSAIAFYRGQMEQFARKDELQVQRLEKQ